MAAGHGDSVREGARARYYLDGAAEADDIDAYPLRLALAQCAVLAENGDFESARAAASDAATIDGDAREKADLELVRPEIEAGRPYRLSAKPRP